MKAVVLERSYGCLNMHLVVPISKLPYIPPPQYWGSLPDGEIRRLGITPVWLSSQGRRDAELCLRLQAKSPIDYITEATVHGEWKVRKHQGIIYALKTTNLLRYANPNKPIPSGAERDALFEYLIEELRRQCQQWGSSGAVLFTLIHEAAKQYAKR